MVLRKRLGSGAPGVALLGILAVATAAPPASGPAAAPGSTVDAGIAAARARNEALQAKVTELEQRNAAGRKQLDARDARIAELERKLQAAGAPASAASAGH